MRFQVVDGLARWLATGEEIGNLGAFVLTGLRLIPTHPVFVSTCNPNPQLPQRAPSSAKAGG